MAFAGPPVVFNPKKLKADVRAQQRRNPAIVAVGRDIRALGGVVIEITTAAAANPATLQHVSERGLLDWDFSIINPMGPSFFGSLDLLVCEPLRPADANLIGAMGE
ncbi:hypothetical protein V5F40_08060 [Xanthobacter sp. DSM 14520]